MDRQPRILFVGYDFGRKGGPELIEAFRSARRQAPEAELVVVGYEGDDERGIRYLGPITDRTALSREYALARAFALPARYEPFGMVFLEAMAHGLPCIATPVGAVPELVQHGENGFIVQPNRPTDLVESLVAVLTNEARTAEMGRAARAAVERSFTWDAVVRRMSPVLEAAASVR